MTPSSSQGTSPLHATESVSVSSTTLQVVLTSGMLASQTHTHSLRSLLESANMTIQNHFSTLPALHTHLASLSLSSTHRLRPSWDTYFLSLCTLASLRSNCMKRRVGAVLVRNNRVLSTGYNGTPRGLTNCAEGGCSRCNGGAAGGTALDECLCLHAEENALLECGRERHVHAYVVQSRLSKRVSEKSSTN
jgi:dCMP deaminase